MTLARRDPYASLSRWAHNSEVKVQILSPLPIEYRCNLRRNSVSECGQNSARDLRVTLRGQVGTQVRGGLCRLRRTCSEVRGAPPVERGTEANRAPYTSTPFCSRQFSKTPTSTSCSTTTTAAACPRCSGPTSILTAGSASTWTRASTSPAPPRRARPRPQRAACERALQRQLLCSRS
jgi:hypothetical protein